MKMKKVFAALLSAMLVFAFAACSNGSSDSGGSSNTGDKPGAGDKPSSGTSEITEIETTGTVSSTTVVLTDDNETAKIAVDDSSYYIFTAAEKTESNISQNVRAVTVDTTKGGTWKFYKDNKLVYEGTYKGDIAELSKIAATTSVETSEGLKLELTVTAVADDAGDLYEISTDAEEATFTFEIKPESDGASTFVFEATIPEIKASSTAVVATGVSVGDGPYIVKCGDYILFSGITEKQLSEKDDSGKSTKDSIIELGGTIIDNEISLTLGVLKNIMSIPDLGVNFIVIYKNGMEAALDEKEFAAFKEQLTVNTHYTSKDDIFIILTDEGYLKAKISGLLPDYESSEDRLPASVGEDIFKGKTVGKEGDSYYDVYGTDGTVISYEGQNYNQETQAYSNYKKSEKYKYSYNAENKKLYKQLIGYYVGDVLYEDMDKYVDADGVFDLNGTNTYSQEYVNVYKNYMKLQKTFVRTYTCDYDADNKTIIIQSAIDTDFSKNSATFSAKEDDKEVMLRYWPALQIYGYGFPRFVEFKDNKAKVAFEYSTRNNSDKPDESPTFDYKIAGYLEISIKINKTSDQKGTATVKLVSMDDNLKEYIKKSHPSDISAESIFAEIGKEVTMEYVDFGYSVVQIE